MASIAMRKSGWMTYDVIYGSTDRMAEEDSIINGFKEHGIFKSPISNATGGQAHCAVCRSPIFCFPSGHLLKHCITIHIRSLKHMEKFKSWQPATESYTKLPLQQKLDVEKPKASNEAQEVHPPSSVDLDPFNKLRHKRKQLYQTPRIQEIVITKTLLPPTNQQFAQAQRALQRQNKKARLSTSKGSTTGEAKATRVVKGTPRLWDDEKEMQLLQEIEKFKDEGIRRQPPPGSHHGILDPNQVFCAHCDKPIVCLNISGYLNMKKIAVHTRTQNHLAKVQLSQKKRQAEQTAVSSPSRRKVNTSKYYRKMQLESYAKDGISKTPPPDSKVGKLNDQQVYCKICDRAFVCFVDNRFSSQSLKQHVSSPSHIASSQKTKAGLIPKETERPQKVTSRETDSQSARQNKLFLKQLERHKKDGIMEFLPRGSSLEKVRSNQVYCKYCDKGITCFDASGELFYSKSIPRHIETRVHVEARMEAATSNDTYSRKNDSAKSDSRTTVAVLKQYKEEHGITDVLPADSSIDFLEPNQAYCIPCQKPLIILRASGTLSLQALERHVESERHKMNLEKEDDDDEDESVTPQSTKSGQDDDVDDKLSSFREHGITKHPPKSVKLNSDQLYCLACEKAIVCVRPTGIPNLQALERHVTREGHLANFDDWQKKRSGSPRQWGGLSATEKKDEVKERVGKFAMHGISMELPTGSEIDSLQPDQLFCRTCEKPIICFRANGSLSLQSIRRHVESQSHLSFLRSKKDSGKAKVRSEMKKTSRKQREQSVQEQLDSFKEYGIIDTLPDSASPSFLKKEQVYCTFCDRALIAFKASGHLDSRSLRRHVESQNHLFNVKSMEREGSPDPKQDKTVREQLEKYQDDGITCEVPADSSITALAPNEVYCTVCDKPIVVFRSNLSLSQQSVERHVSSSAHKHKFKHSPKKSESTPRKASPKAAQDPDEERKSPSEFESFGIVETLPPDATVDTLQANQCYCLVCKKPIACYTKDGIYASLWLERHVTNQTHTAAAKERN